MRPVAVFQNSTNSTPAFRCHPGGRTEAVVLFSLAGLGMGANLLLMFLILSKRALRRSAQLTWSQGLLFHQGLVDCARAAILVPLGISVLRCQGLRRCSILETIFVLLVTVSTLNMLTTVLNDAPLIPDEEVNPLPLLRDSPHCVLFGAGMIWFASLTINLGPTFLTGALAISQDTLDECPLVYGPMRHHVLNILWIVINVLCVLLTCFHLRKLYLDLSAGTASGSIGVGIGGGLGMRLATRFGLGLNFGGSGASAASTGGGGVAGRGGLLATALVAAHCDGEMSDGGGGSGCGDESSSNDLHQPLQQQLRVRSYLQRLEREGLERVKMFVITTVAYVIFWAPLFFITVVDAEPHNYSLTYEVTLHIAFVHAFVNPTLLLVLHKGLRRAAAHLICCYCLDEDPDIDHGLPTSAPSSVGRHTFPDDLVSPCAHYSCALNRNYMETTL